MAEKQYDDAPLTGDVGTGHIIEETPPDIDEFLAASGIKERAYTCSVKRLPKEGGSVPEHLPGQYKDSYPEIEEIGKKFGPGTYFICFSFKTYDQDNKQKRQYKEYRICLGEDYRDMHDDYQAEKWAQSQQRMERIRQSAALKNAYKGKTEGQQQVDPMENLKNMLGVAKDLGVPIGPNAAVPATQGDNTTLAMMMQMMQFMNQQSQKSTELMMTMMMENNKTNTQLMLGILQNNKPQGNNEIMKEVINMVKTTVDLKNALNPEKQGVVDRVFGLMESAFPAIIAIASKPREQRTADPLVQLATSSQEFKQMETDPEMRKEMIRKWNEAHGAEDTDAILETVGWSRDGAINQTPQPTNTDFEDVSNEVPVDESLENPLTGGQADLSGGEE